MCDLAIFLHMAYVALHHMHFLVNLRQKKYFASPSTSDTLAKMLSTLD